MFKGKQIIDISPVISHQTAVFPGDIPFSAEVALDMRKGDNLTLSSFKMSAHIGAHTDAPNHYALNGSAIDARSLDIYLGAAQVIEVNCAPNARIRINDLKNIQISAPRVLFKTRSFPDPDNWNGDFVALSAELIDYLADKKVILVGIDTPSIDPAEDKVLESHTAVFTHDMAILEGIVLDHVESGLYDLIALPLRIAGADATPVRAILLKGENGKE